MSPAQKKDGLEISEDMDFQRKEWNVERWGWIFMLIITVAALLGLFGQGLLSSASAENDALVVRYNRFERLMAPTQLTIRVEQAGIQNGETRLVLAQSLMEAYTVDAIVPQPDSVVLSNRAYTYIFKSDQAAQTSNIVFSLQANRIGPVSGQVGLENSPPVLLRQFIYP